MARWLKQAIDEAERREKDAEVRAAVEAALADIERRGDAAVREMSARFDQWEREDFRLGPAEIEACLAELSAQDLDDIRFAQAQKRLSRKPTDANRPLGIKRLAGRPVEVVFIGSPLSCGV